MPFPVRKFCLSVLLILLITIPCISCTGNAGETSTSNLTTTNAQKTTTEVTAATTVSPASVTPPVTLPETSAAVVPSPSAVKTTTPAPEPEKTEEPEPVPTENATENSVGEVTVTSDSGYIVDKELISQDNQIEIFYITYMSDGYKVKGYLVQPKANGVYPAVIYNRGGNLEFGKLTSMPLQVYARMGFVAIGSQYRGNDGGEGREQFGGDDINDVMNLIPVLKSLPNVNPDKIGMVGYSRGGMMTYLALKEQTLRGTNDIKAACTVGGTSDLFINGKARPEMVTGVFIPLIGGTAQQLPDEFKARSATYWADLINVPLLIQHGEADWRVLPEESEKLAQELETYGKEYKLITYPGDDHGLSAHNRGLYEIFVWLGKYLQVNVNLSQITKTSSSNLSDTLPGEIIDNTFYNEAKGYQVSNLPTDWSTTIPGSPQDIALSTINGAISIGGYGGPAYTITFFNGVNEWWVPAITTKWDKRDVVVTESTEIQISGYRTKKVTFEYTYNEHSYTETTYHIWRPNNNYCLYRIRFTCLKGTESDFEEIFSQVLAGFTFL